VRVLTSFSGVAAGPTFACSGVLRMMEVRHAVRSPAHRTTVARRLCTVVGFYRFAEEECLVPVSPPVHFRCPRLDYESRRGPGP
jgi:site-specific recombinase XerD